MSFIDGAHLVLHSKNTLENCRRPVTFSSANANTDLDNRCFRNCI